MEIFQTARNVFGRRKCEKSHGRSLAVKIKRHRYYWPTMIGDCEKFTQNAKNAKGMPRQSDNQHKFFLPSCYHIL